VPFSRAATRRAEPAVGVAGGDGDRAAAAGWNDSGNPRHQRIVRPLRRTARVCDYSTPRPAPPPRATRSSAPQSGTGPHGHLLGYHPTAQVVITVRTRLRRVETPTRPSMSSRIRRPAVRRRGNTRSISRSNDVVVSRCSSLNSAATASRACPPKPGTRTRNCSTSSAAIDSRVMVASRNTAAARYSALMVSVSITGMSSRLI